jgi:hypothetical protein
MSCFFSFTFFFAGRTSWRKNPGLFRTSARPARPLRRCLTWTNEEKPLCVGHDLGGPYHVDMLYHVLRVYLLFFLAGTGVGLPSSPSISSLVHNPFLPTGRSSSVSPRHGTILLVASVRCQSKSRKQGFEREEMTETLDVSSVEQRLVKPSSRPRRERMVPEVSRYPGCSRCTRLKPEGHAGNTPCSPEASRWQQHKLGCSRSHMGIQLDRHNLWSRVICADELPQRHWLGFKAPPHSLRHLHALDSPLA